LLERKEMFRPNLGVEQEGRKSWKEKILQRRLKTDTTNSAFWDRDGREKSAKLRKSWGLLKLKRHLGREKVPGGPRFLKGGR